MSGLVQPGQHDRRHRHGDDIVGQHGEGDRHGQGHEEILHDAGEKHDRQVDNENADRRDQDRKRQFHGAVFRRRTPVFSHLQVSVQVFLYDDVVVQQGADDQGQPAQRHQVHALAGQVECDQRGGQREGNGQPDHERRFDTRQENENHQAGQSGAEEAFFLQIGDGLADVE